MQNQQEEIQLVLKQGSDRYVISFPPGLKERAEALAKADGRTLNNWLVRLTEMAIYAAMKTVAATVQVDLYRGYLMPDPGPEIDELKSMEKFVQVLAGRIEAAYPAANSGITYGPGFLPASARVFTYPTTPEIERMVKADVEEWIEELRNVPDLWLVKQPS